MLSILNSFLSEVLDSLIELVEFIGDKFENIINGVLGWFDALPSLFMGFLDFIGSVFGFMPDGAVMLITFGLAIILVITIFKVARR